MKGISLVRISLIISALTMIAPDLQAAPATEAAPPSKSSAWSARNCLNLLLDFPFQKFARPVSYEVMAFTFTGYVREVQGRP